MATDFSTADAPNRGIFLVGRHLARFSRMLCLVLKIGDFQ
jgi:hypothetical protein